MKLLLSLFCFLLLSQGIVQGQSYSFSVSSGAYSELINPISLNNEEVWDFPDYTIPIGFECWYFDSTLDTMYFFTEGSGTILSSSNIEGGIHQLLIPFGAALIDRGYGTFASLSPLSYELTGSVGQRILKIQWKNAGFFGDYQYNGTSTDFVNFQLWLYETTGLIEMHYGPSHITQPEIDYTDEVGPGVGLIPSYDWDADTLSSASIWLEGNPVNPFMVNSNDLVFLNGSVSLNTIYQFHNLVVGLPETEIQSFIIYPNPTNDFLNIRFKSSVTSITTVFIHDLTGRSLFSKHFESDNNTREFRIPVSELKAGVYQLCIVSGDKITTSSFIKR